MSGYSCQICTIGSLNHIYKVAEMMTGSGHHFQYGECNTCGTLQLLNAPYNYDSYYEKGYYSTSAAVEPLYTPFYKAVLKSFRDRFVITGKGMVGQCLQAIMPNQAKELFNFRVLGLKPGMRILDIGSGTGKIPYALYNAGFRNTSGIEPFLQNDITYKNGLRIRKANLTDRENEHADVVIFNHAFEHVPNPNEVLQQVYELLEPFGKLYLRIPTASSYAWQHYQENWVQLDAPRHCFLYTVKGLTELASRHGFKVASVQYEGTSFQFIGSEQYKMGVPMYGDKRSWFEGNNNLFTSKQINQFEEKAKQLNVENRGDSIAVYLVKTDNI